MIIIKNKGKEPVIYIRYHEKKILYIGETEDRRKGRPLRDEPKIGDWDYVRLLKAPNNVNRRKYWEAYLICKLKPANQNTINYFKLIKKYNKNTNLDKKELEKEITPESLDKLRRKNNIERSIYWSKQIELAQKHKEQATIFFKHFYSCYLKDKGLDNDVSKEKFIKFQKLHKLKLIEKHRQITNDE